MAYSNEPSSPVGDLLQSEFHRVTHDPPMTTKNQSAFDYEYPWTTNEPLQSGVASRTTQIQTNGNLISDDQFNSKSGGRRSYSSPRSVASTSASSRSSRRNQSSVLDNPLFAPPPERPLNMKQDPVTNLIKRPQNAQILPIFDKITHSGYMLARTSLKSLVMKKWKQVFWITYNDNEVFIFRTKIDFEEWATNPYLTGPQREEIVKLHINFKSGSDHTGARCYRAFSLQSKAYKSIMLNTFKLEQWMHYGPVILGAFASKSPPEIKRFHTICKEMIIRHKCGLRAYLAKERDDIDVQSYGSSYSAKSAPNTINTRFTPGFY